MKKFLCLLLSIFLLLIGDKVYAKDTVYSINKYDKEELNYVLKDNNNFIVLGTYDLKKETHILLINYNKDGSIKWEYDTSEKEANEAYGLVNLNSNDNYIILVKKDSYTFWKIDKDGELLEEKESNLYGTVEVTKVVEDTNGVIIIGSIDGKAFIAKYDEELNLSWIKAYDNTTKMLDLISIQDIGYYGIVEIDNTYQLIKLDIDGNISKVIKNDFEEGDIPKLTKSKESYLVYGITKEVKLEDNKTDSFYIIKYSFDDLEVWDTIGNIPVKEDETLKLQELDDNYYVLSTNSSDNSIEVTKIDSEGIIQEKVKKLKNNYYSMNDFIYSDNIFYFIGQINCPQDDNCDYDNNSLFLVCSEDKVIEVEDKDSKNILIITAVIVVAVCILYVIRKKKVLKKKP